MIAIDLDYWENQVRDVLDKQLEELIELISNSSCTEFVFKSNRYENCIYINNEKVAYITPAGNKILADRSGKDGKITMEEPENGITIKDITYSDKFKGWHTFETLEGYGIVNPLLTEDFWKVQLFILLNKFGQWDTGFSITHATSDIDNESLTITYHLLKTKNWNPDVTKRVARQVPIIEYLTDICNKSSILSGRLINRYSHAQKNVYRILLSIGDNFGPPREHEQRLIKRQNMIQKNFKKGSIEAGIDCQITYVKTNEKGYSDLVWYEYDIIVDLDKIESVYQ